ncbi:Hypothetical predicted protein [Lecanosticta acicola]|uniref:F-box domain-containing protein n=1 Tax=Lecanosticta acicola TaxID=111012 RepID=A0AAI8W1B8_9PEZI|nr:Hypothetical predicted protein [Lecanosticta acicola]
MAENDPCLTGIPAELFEDIAERLPTKSLKALRLTNRECASKVLRNYTQALFTRRAYYVSIEESLKHAIEVAEHPVFGSAVKTMYFLVDQVMGPADVRHPCFEGDGIFIEQNKAFKEHVSFQQRDGDFKLLAELFAILKKRHAKPERVEVVDRATARVCPPSEAAGLHMKPPVSHAKDASRAFFAVVQAIDDSGLEVPTFGGYGLDWSLPLSKIDLNGPGMSAFNSLLTTVQSLHLSFDDFIHTPEDKSSFEKTLSSAPVLKDLRVAGDARWAGRPSDFSIAPWLRSRTINVLLHEKFTSLECLSIKDACLDGKSLIAFAKQHKLLALRRVNLRNVALTDLTGNNVDACARAALMKWMPVSGKYTLVREKRHT